MSNSYILFVPQRLGKHEEIIFSSVYNQDRKDLIIIVIVSEYMHYEVLGSRKMVMVPKSKKTD